MIWLSSRGGSPPGLPPPAPPLAFLGWSLTLNALLQARLDEIVEVAVQHRLGIAALDVGAQVLDARLVEDVGADLVAPADVGLGVLQHLLFLLLLAQFELVELRLEHRHRLGLVSVLGTAVLALHDYAGGQVRYTYRAGVLVHVLAAVPV